MALMYSFGRLNGDNAWRGADCSLRDTYASDLLACMKVIMVYVFKSRLYRFILPMCFPLLGLRCRCVYSQTELLLGFKVLDYLGIISHPTQYLLMPRFHHRRLRHA